MHMPHRPVGVMRQRVDAADGEEGALEGGEPVEDRRHHHEAQRRVVADLPPGAVEREERVCRRGPGRHQQHDREGHPQGLRPVGERGVVQVVRARPDVEEHDPPEGQDRQAVGIDRPLGTLRQVVVEHAEEARGQEEGDRVVAVPPLHHRVLHARPQDVALRATERDRDRDVVEDVEHGHDQDEGHVVPVGHVDMRLGPARERAQVEDEVGHPDHDQPEVGVPLGLGVFLRLGDTHEVARHREDHEELETQKDEPGRELAREPGARGALHHVERGRDQRGAAEAEDHGGGMRWPQAAEARPGGVEGEVGPDEERRDPEADRHADRAPDHREHDAHLDRVVVVGGEPARRRVGRVEIAQDEAEEAGRKEDHDKPVQAERRAPARDRHQEPDDHARHEQSEREAAVPGRQLGDHPGVSPLRGPHPARLRLGVNGAGRRLFRQGRAARRRKRACRW